jgi:hypothetical protein
LQMAWPEDRRGTKFSESTIPRLNGAAYLDFLQNVLNDPVSTIEELAARVMQTAENIRENPEMLMRTQASLVRRTQACTNNEGRHFEHL